MLITLSKITAFFYDRTAPARRDLLILAVTFGVLCFQFLGHFPLMEPDEGRYSEIPREMLERGDFITPTLNYVKYFEKPPLLYWLNSLSFAVFGQNEFAARFPCALAGLLTILFTYWLGRELLGRRVGAIAAVIVGTSAGFIALGRINLTDMPLTFCMTLCLGSFILAVRNKGEHKALYYYLFYVGAALAVLAKGLIGILFPGAIVFLFLLLRKRWRTLREMRLFTGILLFFLVAAPWFILVSMQNPEFPRFFFIHEHIERFLTKVHGRYQPIWYFVPILLGIMLPWSLFIPAALKKVWSERKAERGEISSWLAIWSLFIFIFFSRSNSKLIPYILPVLPPLAILVAVWFDSAEEKGRVFRANFLTCAAALTVTISLIASVAVYSNLSQKKSSKTLALKVLELAAPDDLVASFGYDQSLPFYTKRRTVVVGGMGELKFGSEQGDQSGWFINKEQFHKIWNSKQKVFVIINDKELEDLVLNAKKPPTIITQNRRKILVTNH